MVSSRTMRRIRGKEMFDWIGFNIICERDFEKWIKLNKKS